MKRNKKSSITESNISQEKEKTKEKEKEKTVETYEKVTIRKRHYSPENNNDVTQRILQYFEDPNEADALAKIKRISNRAKKSSKNIRGDVDFSEFVNVKLVNNPFERRKRQFATTKYVPKNKDMNLMDELMERMEEKKKIDKKDNVKKVVENKTIEKKEYGNKENKNAYYEFKQEFKKVIQDIYPR